MFLFHEQLYSLPLNTTSSHFDVIVLNPFVPPALAGLPFCQYLSYICNHGPFCRYTEQILRTMLDAVDIRPGGTRLPSIHHTLGRDQCLGTNCVQESK